MLRAGNFIEQLIAYAERYSMKPFRAVDVALKGELAVNRDEAEAGLDLLRSALEILNVDRYHVLLMTFMGALAEGLRKTGQFEEALFTINGAIARATNSGAEFNLSELLRIKSQILVARDDRGSAVTCLTDALAVARAQSGMPRPICSSSGARDRTRTEPWALCSVLPGGRARCQTMPVRNDI